MWKTHKIHNSSIKVKTGVCPKCENGREVPMIGGMCKNHYWESRRKPTENKVRKPIRKVSKKRAKQNAVYLKARLEYLNEQLNCEICGNSATDIHHKKGRVEELLTDKKYFMALCRPCHQKVELNPEWAKENNYSLSRI